MGEVDVLVGRRIRARRVERGLSMSQLAEAIGVRFQQIQKYETGMNRVSASRLWAIAEALNSPIELFFDNVAIADKQPTEPEGVRWGAFDNRSLKLVRNFQKLPETQKQAVLAIVTSMAASDTGKREDTRAHDT